MRYLATLLLLLVIITGCCHTRKVAATNNMEVTVPDSVIFMVLKISRDTTKNTSSIEIVSQTKTAGKLKEPVNGTYLNTLTAVASHNGKPYGTLVLEHPLYKRVEYPGENGEFVSKQVTGIAEKFVLRMPYRGTGTAIKFYETIQGQPEKEIALLKL